MEPTIYAAFESAQEAERAAGVLIDSGIRPEQINLIVPEMYGQERRKQGHGLTDEELDYTHPHTYARVHDPLNTLDPLNNQIRDTPITIDPSLSLHDLGPGDELRADVNPAQEDYPRSWMGGPESFASAPPNENRDYNRGIQDDDFNKHYDGNVDAENERQWASDDVAREAGAIPSDSEDVLWEHRARRVSETDEMLEATREDAADGAKKGALWGLGVGAAAAVAALAIPGFGVVIGGGAIAAAAASLAAGAGTGAVAGGLYGFMKDQGVPESDVRQYQKTFDNGGAILAVHAADGDRERVLRLLKEQGAKRTDNYGYAA
jgi:uncharacterized membrane protein